MHAKMAHFSMNSRKIQFDLYSKALIYGNVVLINNNKTATCIYILGMIYYNLCVSIALAFELYQSYWMVAHYIHIYAHIYS